MKISESVVKFLIAEDINFSQLGDKTIYRVSLEGKRGTFCTYIDVDEDNEHIECITRCPLRATEDTKADVLRLFAHVNLRLAVGHFDIDLADGDIRFRTSIFAGSSELDPDLIKHLVFMSMTAMDMFIPVIASVICSKIGAEDALRMHAKNTSKNSDTKSSDGQSHGFGGRLGRIIDGSSN